MRLFRLLLPTGQLKAKIMHEERDGGALIKHAAENKDVDRPLPACPLITSASKATCCVLIAQWSFPGLIASIF